MNKSKKAALLGTVGAAGAALAGTSMAVQADSVHKVVQNDTIWTLSQKYGVSMDKLQSDNKIDKNTSLIYVGQELKIADNEQGQNQKTSANEKSVVIQTGDTLWDLAQKYHTTVDELRRLNNMPADAFILQVGATLKVSGEATAIAAQATLATSQASAVTTDVQTSAPVATTSGVDTDTTNEAVASQASAVTTDVQTSAPVATTSGVDTDTTNEAVASQASAVTTDVQTSAPVATTSTVNTTAETSQEPVTSASSTETSAATTEVSPQAENTKVANSATTSSQAEAPVVAAASSTAPETQEVSVASIAQTADNTTSNQVVASNATSQVDTNTQVEANNYGVQAQVYASSYQEPAAATEVQNSYQTPIAETSAQSSYQASSETNTQATSTQPQAATSTSADGSAIASYAQTLSGIPYVWGGSTTSGFDCSGLTQYVYNQYGKDIGRTTYQQQYAGTKIDVSQAQAGDLLFWGNYGDAYHVGIYTGNNQYMAAHDFGELSSTKSISPYYQPSFAVHVN
ncbi:LysM peptidoglycan-binding domain-containing protein [Ligilactobacillus equi]|nr:LysM peptidoglycan-binding domain-containing protein [Ligilactobacillus equi]